MTECDHFLGLLLRPAETMKNTAHPPSVFTHDLERLVPGIALMNDDVQLQLDREIELLLKQARLFALERAVVDFALDFVVRLRLERARDHLRLALLRNCRTRQIMIVEPGLADGGDPRGLFASSRNGVDDIVARLFRVVGMNADDRENIRIFFREFDRAPAAFKRGADREDARHTGFGCAREDVLKISCEVRVVEVGVGIDKHRQTKAAPRLFSSDLFEYFLKPRMTSETIQVGIVFRPLGKLGTAGPDRTLQ